LKGSLFFFFFFPETFPAVTALSEVFSSQLFLSELKPNKVPMQVQRTEGHGN